jgi:hypothetical protein
MAADSSRTRGILAGFGFAFGVVFLLAHAYSMAGIMAAVIAGCGWRELRSRRGAAA